jgi:hypothetical protein
VNRGAAAAFERISDIAANDDRRVLPGSDLQALGLD